MVSITPAALREASAATYLDMPVTTFRDLVSRGALPKPVVISDNVERWKSDELLAILNGKAARPSEDFEL
ncbi:helix-turn-helix transcriptional regulator [Arenibacterium sp. LLYu02]|uniref:helix-turn-helix transcriptional regulator n=1 Tax=Arenibacterium sp. LLYu02 TaxID=3404132 RepID=UPI003B21EFA3